jgi:molecular chaperone DnaJ
LGVDKNSTADEIKDAYKMKAKENHPDKKGGNHEKMTDIVRAYGVLGKEGSRKRG